MDENTGGCRPPDRNKIIGGKKQMTDKGTISES